MTVTAAAAAAPATVSAMTDKIASFGKGSLVIFMNRKATAFKMLAGNDYLVYYNNKGRRIPLDAIQYLPTYFDGTNIEFTKVMERSVMDKLRKKKQ